MRLLPVSLLCALFSSVVIAEPIEKPLGVPDISTPVAETPVEDEDTVKGTLFNGIQVPALPEIPGETFYATVNEGYWFVKHYS